MHLLDIIQNSISANAGKIGITIYVDELIDELGIIVEDNGCGMEKDFLDKVIDPFVTTRKTRKVGIGIPLIKTSAELAGGNLYLESVRGKGTILKATFKIGHIDRLPLGDVSETIASLIAASPEVEFRLLLKNGQNEFEFSTVEVKKLLVDVSITEYNVLTWIREFINEGVKKIFGGVLNEIIS